MTKRPNVAALARYLASTPWACHPELLLQHLSLKLEAREEPAASPAAARPAAPRTGAIGVILIAGVIDQRPGWWNDTSTEQVGEVFDTFLADDSIKAIVLEIDSPGGSVAGLTELAAKIAAAKGQKKVVAVANTMAASAAYWLGSQAQEFYVTPSGEVGSIGVWTMHVDQSKAIEEMGLKLTLISAGKYKVEGNPWEPATEEMVAFTQGQVDGYYDQFVRAVASGRGVPQKAVREGFGQGRMLMAVPAQTENMVDGVASLDEVLGLLGAKLKTAGQTRAMLERRQHLTEAALDCDVG